MPEATWFDIGPGHEEYGEGASFYRLAGCRVGLADMHAWYLKAARSLRKLGRPPAQLHWGKHGGKRHIWVARGSEPSVNPGRHISSLDGYTTLTPMKQARVRMATDLSMMPKRDSTR